MLKPGTFGEQGKAHREWSIGYVGSGRKLVRSGKWGENVKVFPMSIIFSKREVGFSFFFFFFTKVK